MAIGFKSKDQDALIDKCYDEYFECAMGEMQRKRLDVINVLGMVVDDVEREVNRMFKDLFEVDAIRYEACYEGEDKIGNGLLPRIIDLVHENRILLNAYNKFSNGTIMYADIEYMMQNVADKLEAVRQYVDERIAIEKNRPSD